MTNNTSFRLKDRIAVYLKKHNLKPSDIKDYSPVLYNGELCLNVIFKNGSNHYFRFLPFTLNKKGKFFIKTTALTLGAVSVMGIYGNYKFKNKGENIELTPASENEIVLADESVNDQQNVNIEPSVQFEYVDSNNLDPYKMIESSQEYDIKSDNVTYKEIDVVGSSKPNIASYNYVLDNYYDQIDKYGHRYGVDPAIIASTIMVECGASRYDEASQHNYSALGLGQVNAKLFENYTFKNIYNFDTGSFEDYTFKTKNVEGNRDEQIKLIAIMHQASSKLYYGNLNAMEVSYNQGGGTVKKIVDKIVNSSDYISRGDVYSSSETDIISKYNSFTHGDPDYFNKNMSYLATLLHQKAFGSDTASVYVNEKDKVIYSVNTQYKIDVPSR